MVRVVILFLPAELLFEFFSCPRFRDYIVHGGLSSGRLAYGERSVLAEHGDGGNQYVVSGSYGFMFGAV